MTYSLNYPTRPSYLDSYNNRVKEEEKRLGRKLTIKECEVVMNSIQPKTDDPQIQRLNAFKRLNWV